ncbi:MAG: hypothetical protein KDA68_02400 [Planctomycetaceae bacterium]|nr:hypothetical protein [Planctomycetaceae bacterium]
MPLSLFHDSVSSMLRNWIRDFRQSLLRRPLHSRRRSALQNNSIAGVEAIEARLLLTKLTGIWDLHFSWTSDIQDNYQLQLNRKTNESSIELPGIGEVKLTKIRFHGKSFRAKFEIGGTEGRIEGTGDVLDENHQPQELDVTVLLKGSVNLSLAMTSSPVIQSPPHTNDALRQQILFELPELTAALISGETLKAAELILKWAARTGDFALDGSTVNIAAQANSAADLFYNYFEPDVGGMSCGGYGNYFSSLLKLFEIDSLNIGFGQLPLLTHVTVVIPIREAGTWKFYLMDPTFGTTFINPETAQLATLFDLIDFKRAGRLDELSEQTIDLGERDFLSPTPSSIPELTFQGMSSGNYVYHCENYSLGTYLYWWSTSLNNSGYSADQEGFVSLIENWVYNALMYGNQTTMAEARTAFINEVTNRGITFGY